MISQSFIAALLAISSAAVASPYAMPEAYAIAMANPQGASYQCHAFCGNAILAARNCKDDSGCYCDQGTEFRTQMDSCYSCGSSLWSDYGKFLVPYLETCGMKTTPDAAPETSAAPETTKAPETSSAAPETSKAPETSSAAPETSKAPETSSAAPETSKAPETSSEAHKTSSATSSSHTSAHTTTATVAPVKPSHNSTETTITQVNGAPAWKASFGLAAIAGVAALI